MSVERVANGRRDLAVVAQGSDTPTTALYKTAWSPKARLASHEWVRHGHWLGALGRGVGWWIGDWVRYGSIRYGERYELAARITGYDRQSLMNMAYVASRFRVSRRREKLSFSHHAELAPFPEPVQERWLDRAETRRLSVHALRAEVRREARGELDVGGPASTSHQLDLPGELGSQATCPRCGHHFEVAEQSC